MDKNLPPPVKGCPGTRGVTGRSTDETGGVSGVAFLRSGGSDVSHEGLSRRNNPGVEP